MYLELRMPIWYKKLQAKFRKYLILIKQQSIVYYTRRGLKPDKIPRFTDLHKTVVYVECLLAAFIMMT